MRTRACERKFVMPVKRLPSHPSIDHLRHQAKDLLKGHAALILSAAQQIREFHPRFHQATDAEIFAAQLRLSDAQLVIAREHGFAAWTNLKAQIEKAALANQLDLPHHQRIRDAAFRRAVALLDAGDAAALHTHLSQHPNLVHQHVSFEGENYFRNPTLLEFIAENPIRHGTLPPNILDVALVILDAGSPLSSRNEALNLVATGRVPRECGVQIPLIDLLCDHEAEPASATIPAALHGEFEAVDALLRRGAPITLPLAAALGRIDNFRSLLPSAHSEDRHLALTLASQFGHLEIVRILLDSGENPNRYNPVGAHSHSTPLHQAALEGHDEVVRLLIERGARVNMRDLLWQGTPADWARHAGKTELETYLRAQEPNSPKE
jgi:hypothetical protein